MPALENPMPDASEIPAPPSTLPIPEEEELPLAAFESDLREHLRRLQEHGRALVLMEDEYAEAVVLDVEAYERMVEALRDAETVIGFQRGLLECARGESRPAEDVFRDIQAGENGRALVLMEGESAEAVVLDAEAYDRMVDALEETDTIAALYRGLLEGTRGQGRPMDEVFADIRAHAAQRRTA